MSQWSGSKCFWVRVYICGRISMMPSFSNFTIQKQEIHDHGCTQRGHLEKEGSIERVYWLFHQSGSSSGGTGDKLKCWMFKKGLKSNCMFQEKLGLIKSVL